MIGETDVDHRNVIRTAIVDASNGAVERAAELMCRTSIVDHQTVAINEKTELSGVRIVGSVQSNVEIACVVGRRAKRATVATWFRTGRYSTTTTNATRPATTRTQPSLDVDGCPTAIGGTRSCREYDDATMVDRQIIDRMQSGSVDDIEAGSANTSHTLNPPGMQGGYTWTVDIHSL